MLSVHATSKSFLSIIKEVIISSFILVVLLTMDRCLENMYFYLIIMTVVWGSPDAVG